MRFVLVRGDPAAALAEEAASGARLLAVGERLRWVDLPARSAFVVPLCTASNRPAATDPGISAHSP
jgi:hypothetical protein